MGQPSLFSAAFSRCSSGAGQLPLRRDQAHILYGTQLDSIELYLSSRLQQQAVKLTQMATTTHTPRNYTPPPPLGKDGAVALRLTISHMQQAGPSTAQSPEAYCVGRPPCVTAGDA